MSIEIPATVERWRSLPSIKTQRMSTPSVVTRLRQSQGGRNLTRHSILRELLPNQSIMMLATPLVDSELPPLEKRLLKAGSVNVSSGSPTGDHTLKPPRNRIRRCTLVEPLSESTTNDSHLQSESACPVAQYCQYTLRMWENKLFRKDLSNEDALILLFHDDIIKIAECVLVIKTSQMTSDQIMEVEMTLEQIDQSSTKFGKLNPSPMKTPSLCQIICQNVWKHGIAFHYQELRPLPLKCVDSVQSDSNPLKSIQHPRPAISSTARIPSVVPTPSHSEVYSGAISSNQSEFARLRGELHTSQRSLLHYTRHVMDSATWIQGHCLREIAERRSLLFQSIRKAKAVDILMRLFGRKVNIVLALRFRRWRAHSLESACCEAVKRYCQVKSAARILSLARSAVKRSFTRHWNTWLRRVRLEQKLERLAATITLQSWMQMLLSRRYTRSYQLDQAATKLQSFWRGFFCRRILSRRRRYGAYAMSSSIVQRAFRAYRCRYQFAASWRRHKASLCILRSLRRYCARRRLFRSWCDRVARFHLAAIIQVWMRTTLHRIRANRAQARHRHRAAFTLQHFFRHVRFVMLFGSRVQRLFRRRQAAAVTLQNAYRAKQARARFYALKDELEAHRRQQILEVMWYNAYATAIQRWWRSHHPHAAPSE